MEGQMLEAAINHAFRDIAKNGQAFPWCFASFVASLT
jgi:hypothetical protein